MRQKPIATVTWNTTLDERLDVLARTADLSLAEPNYLLASTVVYAGLAVAGYAALRWLRPEDSPTYQATAIAVAFAALAAARLTPGYRARLRDGIRRRQEQQLVRRYGDGECPFSVELHQVGLVASTDGDRTTLPWRSVQAITEDDRDLVIASRLTVVVVRGHAFATDTARLAFASHARQLAEGVKP